MNPSCANCDGGKAGDHPWFCERCVFELEDHAEAMAQALSERIVEEIDRRGAARAERAAARKAMTPTETKAYRRGFRFGIRATHRAQQLAQTVRGGDGVVYPDDQQDQHTTTSRASAESFGLTGSERPPNVRDGSREQGGESGVPAAVSSSDGLKLLGDLVDALADELAHEVSRTPEVQRRVRAAVEVLGPEYQSYLDGWWLA